MEGPAKEIRPKDGPHLMMERLEKGTDNKLILSFFIRALGDPSRKLDVGWSSEGTHPISLNSIFILRSV